MDMQATLRVRLRCLSVSGGRPSVKLGGLQPLVNNLFRHSSLIPTEFQCNQLRGKPLAVVQRSRPGMAENKGFPSV